jgi:hypothetical protein
MTGSRTRWVRPEADAGDPERIAIREALAFGKAVYDRRVALGLSVAELALRAGMTADEIECIKDLLLASGPLRDGLTPAEAAATYATWPAPTATHT